MLRNHADTLSAREEQSYAHDKEMMELNMAHQKELKIMELEVLKIETKIGSWVRIPLTIIRLPVLILFVIPLSIYAAKKQDVPAELWRLLK